jgi:TatD DNase family protein
MYLAHVCAAVAEARGETVEQVAASTTRAAREFFGL